MRLYIKLIALLLATATLQRSLLSNDTPSEIWFGLRCSFAYTIHDKQMIDKLAQLPLAFQPGERWPDYDEALATTSRQRRPTAMQLKYS